MLYFDSSALIKHYQKEDGSDALEQRLQVERESSRVVFTSVLTYAEIHAIVARQVREKRLSAKEASEVRSRFDADWAFELTPIELVAAVLVFIPAIVKAHALRGADAVHLASALWLRDTTRLGMQPGRVYEEITFASSDQQLCRAAGKFNLEIFNPLTTK